MKLNTTLSINIQLCREMPIEIGVGFKLRYVLYFIFIFYIVNPLTLRAAKRLMLYLKTK
jgi:hypothetical protein